MQFSSRGEIDCKVRLQFHVFCVRRDFHSSWCLVLEQQFNVPYGNFTLHFGSVILTAVQFVVSSTELSHLLPTWLR